MPTINFVAILATLTRHDVRFIVVGGVGAVLQGVPVSTFDLDIVHARDDDNLKHIEAALHDLDAYYRIQPERHIIPTPSHLASKGHHNLMTTYGPLDLLGSVGHAETYETLYPNTTELVVDTFTIRVLNLSVLIRVKEETAQEKDRASLPLMKETLAKLRRTE